MKAIYIGGIGALTVAAVTFMAISKSDPMTASAMVAPATSAMSSAMASNPLTAAKAPALVGEDWIGEKASVAKYQAPLTLVHFWTFGCINCRHNLPVYAAYQKQFKDRGLAIIGIHTPELQNERDINNVKAEVKKLGITYPVLVDGENVNWNKWHVNAWPTFFLVDRNGKVRDSWIGEVGDDTAKWSERIDTLLKEAGR